MEKTFGKTTRISVAQSENYISANNDYANNIIRFYTREPSIDLVYPYDSGWEEIHYFTDRHKRNILTNGEGDETIYILSNPSFPSLYKIGYTRLDIKIRLRDLSKSSGVPTAFRLEYIFKCFNGKALEREIHNKLNEFRNSNQREFFEIDLGVAIEEVKALGINYI